MERISITISGRYETLDDLTAGRPTGIIGDSYLVGDDLYVWSSTAKKWVNVGNLKGSKDDTAEYPRFIPLKEVARRIRKHPSTIRRWWEQDPPLFPRPRRIGPNSIGFVDIEVNYWILTRRVVGSEGAQHFSRDNDDGDHEQKERGAGRAMCPARLSSFIRPRSPLMVRGHKPGDGSTPKTKKED